jgi:hypothetical protein
MGLAIHLVNGRGHFFKRQEAIVAPSAAMAGSRVVYGVGKEVKVNDKARTVAVIVLPIDSNRA